MNTVHLSSVLKINSCFAPRSDECYCALKNLVRGALILFLDFKSGKKPYIVRNLASKMQKQPLDKLYESLVVQPSAAYRAAIGAPVNLDPVAFSQLLDRLRDYHHLYPGMTFWLIVEFKTLAISASDGDVAFFGRKLNTLKDMFRMINPDYVLPFLRWRAAAYELAFKQNNKIVPLEFGYRQSVPLKEKDGQFFWFAMYSTIAQSDANEKIVTILQTFHLEGKWTEHNQRPFEAGIQTRNFSETALDRDLISQLSLSLIDEFTNAELDLLSLYGSGKSVEEILQIKSWSRHTLHEYNANLLKKAKNLFVYDFRNARDFAEYCLKKGFIRGRDRH